MNEAAEGLNRSLEESEIRNKDERKLRRDGGGPPVQFGVDPGLTCPELCCSFVEQCKTWLINHIRQRHGTGAQVQLYTLPQLWGSALETRSCKAYEALLSKLTQVRHSAPTHLVTVACIACANAEKENMCVCVSECIQG